MISWEIRAEPAVSSSARLSSEADADRRIVERPRRVRRDSDAHRSPGIGTICGPAAPRGGATADEAELVASSLVDSNLCGHESHGVVRIPDYVVQMRSGELVPDANLEIIAETVGVLVADAQFGFGQVQSVRMIDRLVPKAREVGTASGTIRNCGHVGRLGEWAERIAATGLAGLVSVNDNGVLKCVAPPGGLAPCISTNPVSIGVPAGDNSARARHLDDAVANGKIRVAHLAGQECPDGWLQDPQGNPTRDPASRFADPPATILPLGGDQDYKGFGLGLLLDILIAGLSGGFCPPAEESAPQTNNVLFVLWDPARFVGLPHFVRESQKLIEFVRSSPRKSNVEMIRLPGDRSKSERARRRVDGIPIDAGTWDSLATLGQSLGIEAPATSSNRA